MLRRICFALLITAVAVLLYVDIHQARTIAMQKHLIIDMFRFIQAGCPFSQLN